MSGQWHRPLVVLWGAVGIILLIACVNLSNLMLVRAAARSKELAVRGALGATRARLVRQSLTESLAFRGRCGAWPGQRLCHRSLACASRRPGFASVERRDDRRTAVAWTIMSLSSRPHSSAWCRLEDGRRQRAGGAQGLGAGRGRGHRHERLRIGLVISEIAMACVLLVGAGLLLRSFLNVLEVDLGFAPDRAATIAVDYNEMAPFRRNARGQTIDDIPEHPGTRARAAGRRDGRHFADYLPLGPNRSWGTLAPKGKIFRPGEVPPPLVYVVTPGVLPAMGIRLRGRDFTWADGFKGQLVVVINASAARFYWPGEDAIGKFLTSALRNCRSSASPTMCARRTSKVPGAGRSTTPRPRETLRRRTSRRPLAAAARFARTGRPSRLARAEPPAAAGRVQASPTARQPLPVASAVLPAARRRHGEPRTVPGRARDPRRHLILGGAAVARDWRPDGARREREPCRSRHSARHVSRDAVGHRRGSRRLAGRGSPYRLVAFRTSPWDLPTYVAMAAVFLAVALISGYLPARKASRVDPMVALRSS